MQPEVRDILKDIISNEEKKLFDSVIIHYHGGGFVGMSSSSHQVYLRKWARKLQVPVFSIEYRLAPQTKYPFVVNDAIRGYLWVITFLQSFLGCIPRKIIVTGDSAGGNLALCVTNWCIEHGFRVPDMLQVHYPATALDTRTFSPSLLYSVEDYLLHYNVLLGILDMYLPPNSDLRRNYYISPLATPDHILTRYPYSEIFVCERDPLRDGGIKLASRLL